MKKHLLAVALFMLMELLSFAEKNTRLKEEAINIILQNGFYEVICDITSDDEKTTRTAYKSEYGEGSYTVRCAYGIGSDWEGVIEKVTVRFENNLRFGYPRQIMMSGQNILNKFHRVSGDIFESEFKNVRTGNSTNEIILWMDTIFHEGPKKFPLNFPYVKRIVSEEDLRWIRTENLGDIEDTIRALHGANFSDEKKKAYFEEWGKWWYKPYKVNPNFSENDFSEIEKENIRRLKKEVGRRK